MDSRDRLLQELHTARGLVRAYFETPDCRWEGRFHHDQADCRQCADVGVCEWLFEQDPAPDVSALSQRQICDVLSFAAGYLDGRMVEAGHDTDQCGCATCSWVRGSLALIQQS
jgi:hypothetical protein